MSNRGDETGADVPRGQGGFLVVKRPWPADDPHFCGNAERFQTSYYPADFDGRLLYLAGDGFDPDNDTGYFDHRPAASTMC